MRRGGFTLLELVVVLAIVAAVAGVVAVQLSSASGAVHVKAAARELASALRYARSRAIAEQRETAVVLDARKHRYPGVALELVVGQAEALDEHRGAVRFYPDGSSSGARLRLMAGGRSQVVDVDWMTGRVVIHDL